MLSSVDIILFGQLRAEIDDPPRRAFVYGTAKDIG